MVNMHLSMSRENTFDLFNLHERQQVSQCYSDPIYQRPSPEADGSSRSSPIQYFQNKKHATQNIKFKLFVYEKKRVGGESRN